MPQLRIAVVGFGLPGGMPEETLDLRTTSIDAGTERRWCEEYAASHLVIGIHGSSMLLPSAHAGGVLELLPPDRLGNLGQDLLVRGDVRDALARYRFVDQQTSPDDVAKAAHSFITEYPELSLSALDKLSDHSTAASAVSWPNQWQRVRLRRRSTQ
jgi:hypothetical protein